MHAVTGKHTFPTGIRSKDKVVLGDDSLGLDDTVCFGQFNRIEKRPIYHKPDKLRNELKRLYNIGSDGTTPKLNANQMHEELRKMIDPADDGLMFCHAKRGTHVAKSDAAYKNWQGCPICEEFKSCVCNGILPPVAMIHTFIGSLTQNKKSRGVVLMND